MRQLINAGLDLYGLALSPHLLLDIPTLIEKGSDYLLARLALKSRPEDNACLISFCENVPSICGVKRWWWTD